MIREQVLIAAYYDVSALPTSYIDEVKGCGDDLRREHYAGQSDHIEVSYYTEVCDWIEHSARIDAEHLRRVSFTDEDLDPVAPAGSVDRQGNDLIDCTFLDDELGICRVHSTCKYDGYCCLWYTSEDSNGRTEKNRSRVTEVRKWVEQHPEGNDPGEQEALSPAAAEAEATKTAGGTSGAAATAGKEDRPRPKSTKKGKELIGMSWVDSDNIEMGLCKALKTCQKSRQLCIMYSSELPDEYGNSEHVSTVEEVRSWVFPGQ